MLVQTVRFVRALRFALVACFLPLLCGVCHALPIAAGGIQSPAANEVDPTDALLVFTTGPISFSTATFSGFLTSSVWNNDSSNTFGLDRLTFTYEITNDVASPDAIARLAVSNFNLFSTDASYDSTFGGTAPDLITRSSNGAVMGFTFVSGLAPGSNSALLVVQTNAAFYQPTIASLIDGSVASVASLAPTAVNTPEPSSVVLLGLGVAGLLAAARRRK